MLDRILRAEIAGMFDGQFRVKSPNGQIARLQACKIEIEILKIADCRLID